VLELDEATVDLTHDLARQRCAMLRSSGRHGHQQRDGK
jgi:hypothetical protein